MTIRDNINKVKEQIARACHISGRDPEEVEIVAVSKTVQVNRIKEAISAGIRRIGENRVQEAWQKFNLLQEPVKWHLVGHLQTNKVKKALEFIDIVESVDSLHLAQEINRRAESLKNKVKIFVQVNTSGEASQFGIAPEKTVDFVAQLSEMSCLEIKGLMTIAPFVENQKEIRASFRLLRELKEKANALKIVNLYLQHLSMGMTNDFEIGVQEGATMVRIGRAIFGEREDLSTKSMLSR